MQYIWNIDQCSCYLWVHFETLVRQHHQQYNSVVSKAMPTINVNNVRSRWWVLRSPAVKIKTNTRVKDYLRSSCQVKGHEFRDHQQWKSRPTPGLRTCASNQVHVWLTSKYLEIKLSGQGSWVLRSPAVKIKTNTRVKDLCLKPSTCLVNLQVPRGQVDHIPNMDMSDCFWHIHTYLEINLLTFPIWIRHTKIELWNTEKDATVRPHLKSGRQQETESN